MKIIVLAGGHDQIAFINELKRRGHYVILIDYFEHPIAKQYADKHIKESTLDVDSVLKIAIDEKVDLITTVCTDQALLTMAEVSEKLSLPSYLSYEKALHVTNKAYMKKIMLSHTIPTSRYVIINKFSKELFSNFEFPLVVKPVDCNSSKGVKKTHSMDDLEKQFDEAVKLSKSKTVIVEEFNEGKELSVDFYVEGKQAKLLCVTNSNKIKNNNDSFTILQSFYPAVSVEEEAKITSIAQKIVDAFALYDMPLLVQMIENKGIYNVVEFSARMGGGSKTSLIKVLTGVDMISVFTNRILGEKSSVNPQKLINYATMNYVYCHSGVFAEIKNFYELQKENIIREYYVYKYPGTFISKHETSSDRAAGYLLISENQEEMNDKLKHANRELQILDEHGKDMMMHDLL